MFFGDARNILKNHARISVEFITDFCDFSDDQKYLKCITSTKEHLGVNKTVIKFLIPSKI